MPNTYLVCRHPVFRPVIWSAQPQSEPGTGCGTPIVRTTGFPIDDMYLVVRRSDEWSAVQRRTCSFG